MTYRFRRFMLDDWNELLSVHALYHDSFSWFWTTASCCLLVWMRRASPRMLHSFCVRASEKVPGFACKLVCFQGLGGMGAVAPAAV